MTTTELRHTTAANFEAAGRHHRTAGLVVLVGSQLGVGCLVLAYRLQPSDESPLGSSPSSTIEWVALFAGIAGVCLAPGLWLSAVMMRTGAGVVARLATWIGSTLAWYALVGPVVHVLARDALVTTRGIIGMTVAATAAVSLGLLLRLIGRPAAPRRRVVVAAFAGGIFAQSVIWLSMLLVNEGVNYEHIRRLDWLIVLGCAGLTAVGAHSRPDLPPVRTAKQLRTVLVFLSVAGAVAVALLATGSKWSPAQRMPSAISAEQVPEPPGADVAFALTAIGPDGPNILRRSLFTVFDEIGRPALARTHVAGDAMADAATLVVVLDPGIRPALCERAFADSHQGRAVKLTVRDQNSGVSVQAVIPAGWCVR